MISAFQCSNLYCLATVRLGKQTRYILIIKKEKHLRVSLDVNIPREIANSSVTLKK